MSVHRSHPLTILGNLWKVLFLIILPLVRGFFLALQDNLPAWIEGAWMDILVFLVMLAFAVARWWSLSFWWDNDLLHIKSGVIYGAHTVIPRARIVTLSVTDSFYLRPFRAVRLRLDTMGGSRRDADFTLLLRPSVARALLDPFGGGAEGPTDGYSPRTRAVIALSLLNSNSFVGVIFIATFISQSGKLLGEEFSTLIIGTFEEVARTLAFGIPPAAAAIAYLLLGGWGVSFLLSFFRYKNMTVTRRGDMLCINGGAVTRRTYRIRYGDIVFLDIRQSLAAKRLGLYSLYISAVGYGKREDDITCLIPTEKAGAFSETRLWLFPGVSPAPRQLSPGGRGILRFIGAALWPILLIPLLTGLTLWRLESWGPFVLFTGSMAMAPSLVFLAVRITDFRTGGLARQGDFFTLRYSKGLSLHTVVVGLDKIVQVELRQSPFQRKKGSCDALVYTRAEGRAVHRLRSVDLEKARELFASARPFVV